MLLGLFRRFVGRYRTRLRRGTCRRLLLSALRFLGFDPLLRVGRLRLLTLRALPTLIPAIGCNNTVIMLGMLEEIFSADSVSGRQCVLRQGLIFLNDLERGSADLSFGSVALKSRAAPVKTGTPPVASIPASAFAVRTLHTNCLLT